MGDPGATGHLPMHTSAIVTLSFFSCHNGPHLLLDGKADMAVIGLLMLLYSFHCFGFISIYRGRSSRFVRESNPWLQIDNLRCYRYTNEPDRSRHTFPMLAVSCSYGRRSSFTLRFQEMGDGRLQQKTPHLVRGLSYSDLMINLSYSMTCPAGGSIRFGIELAYKAGICGHAKHFSKILTIQRLEYFSDHTKLLHEFFLFSILR